MRPFGPEPASCARSTPASRARRRIAGDVAIRPAREVGISVAPLPFPRLAAEVDAGLDTLATDADRAGAEVGRAGVEEACGVVEEACGGVEETRAGGAEGG